MADVLVAAHGLNTRMGRDGLVMASDRQTLFCSTGVLATNTLRIYRSTDQGATWSQFASFTVNNLECALFMDTADRLHVAHKNPTDRGLTYRRYDPPNYTLALNEAAVSSGSVDTWSPLGIVQKSNGRVYLFYQMTIAAPQYSLRYAWRETNGVWTTDIVAWNAGFGDGISYDVLLGGDDNIYLARQAYTWGSPTDSGGKTARVVRLALTGNPDVGTTVISSLSLTTRTNFWLAWANSEIRAYYSAADGVAGANTIYYQTPTVAHTSLLTASDANDALRGISQDSQGINLYYGQGTVTPLLRRKHNTDGSLGSEVTEVATYDRVLGDVDGLQVAYLRSISGWAGGVGIYGQPSGSTRFFSSLSDTTPPTVTITTPTSGATYSTGNSPLTVAGTASDNVGVTSVTWSNSRGGSGTASGTTSWTASIPLSPGSNTLTITASDAAGNQGTDTLTVTYLPGGASGIDFLGDFGVDLGDLGGLIPLAGGYLPASVLSPGEEILKMLGRRKKRRKRE